MAALLDDLLDVARITQSKLELRREPVELAPVLEQAIESARPLIERRRHHLQVQQPGSPVGLEADPVCLAQIVSNLLTNAAKYTEEGGRIELVATVQGQALVLAVSDTGIGSPADALASIFEMLPQVGDRQHRPEGGLGFGLALVKGLVELHGGSVDALSAGRGAGSEFRVRLPLGVASRTSRPGPVASASESGPRPSRALRVLVADDNVDAAESLALLLQIEGYEVYVAHDGEQSLALARQASPEVALLDIGMPGMSGYEVARAMCAGAAPIRRPGLVALTGWDQDADRQAADEAGFDLHLTKPVDPAHLAVAVTSLAASRGVSERERSAG